MNTAIDFITIWLENCELQLAPGKTEAVMLTRKRAFQYLRIGVNDYEIEIKELIRYLGIKLDAKLKFTVHITKIAGKAQSRHLPLAG